jgi:uncharacterized protein involved in exopolysaccharide biosynthesis
MGAKLRLQVLHAQVEQMNSSRTRPAGMPQTPVQTADPLGALMSELEELEQKYTPLHPDVIRVKGQIEKLKQKTAGRADQGAVGGALSETRTDSRSRQSPEQLEISERKRGIAHLEEQYKEISKQVVKYRKRLEATPQREQELMSLRRDYQNIQEAYNSLLNRKLESEMAVNMEKRQQGEQFRIVDIAKKPQKPASPNMRKLFLFTVCAGLGIGGGIIFLLETLTPSFKDTHSIETQLALPVIVSLPELSSPRVKFLRHLDLALSIIGLFVSASLVAFFAALSFLGEKEVMALLTRVIDL